MNTFSRMSLKARIQLGFAGVTGVLVLALAFFAQAQFKLGALERESVRRFADATTLNEVAQRVIGVSALFGDAAVNRDLAASEKAFREAHASAEADIKLVAGIVDTEEEKARVEEFGRTYRAYLSIFDNDLAPVLRAAGSDATEKIRVVDEKLDQAREHALKPLKEIEESVEAEARHEQELFEQTFRRGLWLAGGLGLAGLLAAALISYFLSERIARVLRASIDTLTQTVRQMTDASHGLAAASQQLAQSNSEQAAALQETSASIEEINAMIGKSAGNAQESESVARESAEAAGGGRETAQKTLTTMHQISDTNDRILRQIEETNTSISSITRLITEIGDKTKVINDIVFQTKLLSFNASVEAARAGEHGKGFAVVAEEVGNLAQMSGNAATEINAMLESSVAKVEAVAREMQSRAEKLIREGREMVAAGVGSAQESGKALEEIAQKAGSVAQIVSEISTAMKEQAQGAAEITKAIGQLDQVTQQNTTVSQQVASSASRLTDDSQRLTQIVEELRVLSYGG